MDAILSTGSSNGLRAANYQAEGPKIINQVFLFSSVLVVIYCSPRGRWRLWHSSSYLVNPLSIVSILEMYMHTKNSVLDEMSFSLKKNMRRIRSQFFSLHFSRFIYIKMLCTSVQVLVLDVSVRTPHST